MRKIVLGILAVLAITSLVACGNKEEVNSVSEDTNNDVTETVSEVVEIETPKEEQTGTAGSNIPLKDNHDKAEYEIKVAMQNWLEKEYGDEVVDARIYVQKIYTAEDEQEIEPLKEMNLGPNEVAFEVNYELKLADEVEDIMKYTAATGEYDEESGWIREKFNLGVLRPNDSGDEKYIITDFGTGW